MKKLILWTNIFIVCFLVLNTFASKGNIVKAEPMDTESNSVSVFNNDGNSIYIDKSDIELMARVVYGESRGEPYEVKVAFASVILNRVKSGKYPPSVKAVITQENAFSCVSNGTISVTPNDSCYNAVYDALNGNDPTGNALFFYNPSISTCSWMENTVKKNATSIGNHVFFSI